MKNRIGNRPCISIAVGLTSMALTAGLANANLSLTLSEPGVPPATFTDLSNTGVISTLSPYGSYNLVDISVASSNKLQSPTPTEAVLEVTSIVESNVGNPATPLTITVNDNGFTFPGATGTNIFMDSSLGGTLAPSTPGDQVTFQSTATATSAVAASNVSSGLQTYLAPATPVGNGAFTEPDANLTFGRGSAFDLTSQIVIKLQNPFETANVSGTTTASRAQVPEPATIAASAGMLAMLSMRRRRNRSGAQI